MMVPRLLLLTALLVFGTFYEKLFVFLVASHFLDFGFVMRRVTGQWKERRFKLLQFLITSYLITKVISIVLNIYICTHTERV